MEFPICCKRFFYNFFWYSGPKFLLVFNSRLKFRLLEIFELHQTMIIQEENILQLLDYRVCSN
jgi:hypothetical protein